MRKVTLITFAVLLLAGGALWLVSHPEALNQVGLGGDGGQLRQITRSFMEDIQFKDFAKAASYHAPDERKNVDVPFLLERLFILKPEQLDIMEYEILFAKIDSSDHRGRVKTRIKAKDLLHGKIREREMMLYFFRNSQNDPWFMRLESSLRALHGDPKKKH